MILSTSDMLNLLPEADDSVDSKLANWPILYGWLSTSKGDPADVAALRTNLVSVMMLIKREREDKNRDYMLNILLGNSVTLRRKIDRLEMGITTEATDEKA